MTIKTILNYKHSTIKKDDTRIKDLSIRPAKGYRNAYVICYKNKPVIFANDTVSRVSHLLSNYLTYGETNLLGNPSDY